MLLSVITNPFTLSVETDEGTYQYGYHLGTIEPTARQCAEEVFLHTVPRKGTRIVTVALMHEGHMLDVFDGEWFSETDTALCAAIRR